MKFTMITFAAALGSANALTELQGSNLNRATPPGSLEACIGECDSDVDCKAGLKCFQRPETGTKIPGCSGEGEADDWDYCYNPLVDGYLTELQGTNNRNTPRGSLEACIGECDRDRDCKAGLKCFQRPEAGTVIPGCSGTGERDGWDYCFDPLYLTPLQGSNLNRATPPGSLEACIGECDSDVDCKAGLKCFQRPETGTKIPGCSGEGEADDWDYCYNPQFLTPLQGTNNRNTPPGSLEACIGECDSDVDCKAGLKCFQRPTMGIPVPGCSGEGETDNWDYCYDPTFNPDNMATPLQGSNLNGDTVPGSLEACIGECDRDADCKAGLKCFKRPNHGTVIPGCSGTGETAGWDYCFDPSYLTPLQGSNLDGNTIPGSLEACIGECDSDVDCKAGLKCFQRPETGTVIPGCSGEGEADDWDYCYDPSLTDTPTASPTLSPTAAPTANVYSAAAQAQITASLEDQSECNPTNCLEWNCERWCECFNLDFETANYYADMGCGQDDGIDECNC